jgi:hypothetical protein
LKVSFRQPKWQEVPIAEGGIQHIPSWRTKARIWKGQVTTNGRLFPCCAYSTPKRRGSLWRHLFLTKILSELCNKIMERCNSVTLCSSEPRFSIWN